MKIRYENSIKWKRWGTRQYTDFAVTHEGKMCEVHVIRHKTSGCDKLLMLIFTRKGVVERSADVESNRVIRTLNDLTLGDYKIMWKLGSQPQKVKKRETIRERYKTREQAQTIEELEVLRLRVRELELKAQLKETDGIELGKKKRLERFSSLKSMDQID